MIDVDVALARPGFQLAIAFSAGPGITGIFGPSGSGKSTLLALIAGIERPDRGRIAIGDRILNDTSTGVFLPTHRRRIGLVFQDAQLFPHLSVRRNLGFGRFFNRRSRHAVDEGRVLGALGIAHLLDRAPATLSGGERQRVAIGRALLAGPELLLMDEPLAALDMARRREILPLIEHVARDFAVPVLYVSHAVDEIARLARHVVRLEDGKVAAEGRAADVLTGGAVETPFDIRSILTGIAGPEDPPGFRLINHPAGDIGLISPPGAEAPLAGETVRIIIRASDVALAREAPARSTIRTVLAGAITAAEPLPMGLMRVTLALAGGDSLTALVTAPGHAALDAAIGDRVVALVKAAALGDAGRR